MCKDELYIPRSKEARIAILEKIYDDTLDCLRECVDNKKTSGSAAWTTVLERSRLEILELQRTRDSQSDTKVILEFRRPDQDEIEA